jgi:hypothetical protein
VFTNSRSAALSALCCLSVAASCGDPMEPLAEPTEPADGLTQEVETNLGKDGKDAAPAEPEAAPETSSALDAPMSAWPIALEVFALDGATFADAALIVAARTPSGPLLVRYDRRETEGPVERDRVALTREQTSPLFIGEHGASPVALWTADGHLEALMPRADAPLEAARPMKLVAEEGGAFVGAPVAALSDEGALVCLVDGETPLCIGLDRDLAPLGLHALSKYKQFKPVALTPQADGLNLVLSRCLGESCGRSALLALRLDADGTPRGKARGLPEIQTGRGLVIIPDDTGLTLVARRTGAGEHAAWQLTDKVLRELDGRFSRVVGGFEVAGRPLFVERSYLRMRDGFPISGFVTRAVDQEAKSKRARIVRESFPDAVDRALPTDVDQQFLASGDTLIFKGPRREGRIAATIVRLGAK